MIPNQPGTKESQARAMLLWLIPAACFLAAFGAYTGHLWLMSIGILLPAIVFVLRFPRERR